MLTFGERLRMARERAGLTQIEVYKTINLNNKSLSHYENNKTSPDPATIRALIELYDVSADFILGLSNKMGHARPNTWKGKPKTDDPYFPNAAMDKLRLLSPKAKGRVMEYIDMLKIIEKVNPAILGIEKSSKT